jgi:hypothetical protein
MASRKRSKTAPLCANSTLSTLPARW